MAQWSYEPTREQTPIIRPNMAPQLEAASIDDALLKTIYDQDQALHPAALSFSRLQSWHDACPNLSIVCKLNGNAVGAIIAMPLQKQSWEDLLSGRLKEHHVETSMFVAEGAEGKDVGLHVFHVERFEGHEAVRGIGKLATKLLQDVANKKSWNIVGYSGEYLPARFLAPSDD